MRYTHTHTRTHTPCGVFTLLGHNRDTHTHPERQDRDGFLTGEAEGLGKVKSPSHSLKKVAKLDPGGASSQGHTSTCFKLLPKPKVKVHTRSFEWQIDRLSCNQARVKSSTSSKLQDLADYR